MINEANQDVQEEHKSARSEYSACSFDSEDLLEAEPGQVHASKIEEANAQGASRSLLKKKAGVTQKGPK